MTNQAQSPSTFAYRAQTSDGQTISGTIDAADLAQAGQRLQSLQLQVAQLRPAPRSLRAQPLGNEEFLAFNQQLAQLTGAGLPVEQGLRLIAQEMRRGATRQAIDLVAAELETGKSLSQAIDAHRGQFPPLYSRLIDAGIRAGNLPAVLLNLGRHLTLVRRLQATLWRTFAYPIIVLAVFVGVFSFLLVDVVPKIGMILQSFRTELPWMTWAVLDISVALTGWVLWFILGAMALLVVFMVIVLRMIGRRRVLAERLLLAIPLIGALLRKNLVARWCDAVGLGVEAGMDLLAAIELADDAIGSHRLRADGRIIVAAISAGRPIAQASAGKILPPVVLAALDLSITQNNLPQGLRSLSQLYEQQAELRLATIQGVLTPIILLLMGIAVAVVIVALFMPIISLISALGAPMMFVPHHH